jgi:CHAT domain-containing protein/tetratricopeptide (TPR) repeat protein
LAARRAVHSLQRARRGAPRNDSILDELAVAYATLAERTQELEPMLHALDAVERAASRESPRPATLFNRALILERLYLRGSAERAWAGYAAIERDPGWRREAAARARRLRPAQGRIAWDALTGHGPRGRPPSPDTILAWAKRSPQGVREFGFRVLGEWGDAELRHETPRAVALLALARRLAAAAGAASEDRTLALWLGAITAAQGDPGRLHALALGHSRLAAGLREFRGGFYGRSASTLLVAERTLRRTRAPAARWATFYRAAAGLQDGRYALAGTLLRRVLAQARPGMEPALVGKSYAALGLCELRQGNYEPAVDLYGRAARPMQRAGETETEGLVAVMRAEALTLAGQPAEAGPEAYRALRILAPFRSSNFLTNHLSTVATHARRAGLPYAALALRDERVAVARALGTPAVVALALSERARDLAALGRNAASRADLREALEWRDRIGAGGDGRRLRANIDLAAGQLERPEHPREALRLLSRAVGVYGSLDRDLYLPTALSEGALAALASGDTTLALRWLKRAVRHVERQQATFASAEDRAGFYESVENVFDAIVTLELQTRRPGSAFEYLERSRAVWSQRLRAPIGEDGVRLVQSSLAEGMVLVEYALLDREVVAWTFSRGGWHCHRIPAARDTVAMLVDRFRREAWSTPTSPRDASTRLYDLLLRPLAGELRGATRLIVVPDRELYAVSFAALRDGVRGRYVVEDLAVSTQPSAALFVAARQRPPRRRGAVGALVVGNPTLGHELARDLGPLRGAAGEAAAVAALYPRDTLLGAAEATRTAVEENLPRYPVFHFAGHSVFDAERPERSYLALAPSSRDDAGRFTAGEIGRLRLSRVDVAVLAACSTLSPRATRTGPVAGLAYSFLRAGVPATVSTLWDVGDGTTAELLVDFHRHLVAGTPAPEALRRAQVRALRSTRPELRVPRTWGVFIYTGP